MSNSHLPNYSFAQLVHQWTPKNGNTEAIVEVSETRSDVPEPSVDEEAKPLSKLERLQYVGGIRRIEVKRVSPKQAGIESPVGQQNLAKMNLMKKS